MLPLLLYMGSSAVDATSFADDLSLLADFPAIKACLPKLQGYLSCLGLQLNPDKSKWSVIAGSGSTLESDVIDFLATGHCGVLAGNTMKTLGVLLRNSVDPSAGELWGDLQGERETIYVRRLQL